MQLIVMLDAPYAGPAAISLRSSSIPFQHCAVSVVIALDAFRRLHSFAEAPAPICDDGTILIDSKPIFEYAQPAVPPLAPSP